MIHVRIDNDERNFMQRFACGLGPQLPEGDTYYDQAESRARLADCPGCNPGGPRQLGTPLSELTYARFEQIAASWGYQ